MDPIAPMLAVAGPVPPGDGWAFEFKWDGVRAITYLEDGVTRVLARSGRDVTSSYPETQLLAAAIGTDRVVLDGELVAFDPRGRPDFGLLQSRMHVTRPRAELLRETPATYVVFDLLVWEGRSTMRLPYDDRRGLVDALGLDAVAHVDVPPSYADTPGDVLLDAARHSGLEGIVAKRRDSVYEPGRRSQAWVKVPLIRTQEAVVGGWQPGAGRRSGSIGSLLLGVSEPAGLRFVGHVGTGFTVAALTTLAAQLEGLERSRSPFLDVPHLRARNARWVEPVLVGEVEFRNWTRKGRLRAASWRGLRPDRDPAEVTVSDP